MENIYNIMEQIKSYSNQSDLFFKYRNPYLINHIFF